MNVDEDIQDEKMLTDNPQRLSAAIRRCGREYLEEEDEDGENLIDHKDTKDTKERKNTHAENR